MEHDGRFREAYVALVALCWQALEHIDRLLLDAPGACTTPCIEGRLLWLRLELLLLGASTMRCLEMQQLSIAQYGQVQTMVSAVLEWLDFDAVTPPGVVRLRIGEAQDWLLEEALGAERAGARDHVAAAPARSAM